MSALSGSQQERAVVAPGVKPPLAVPRRLLRMRSDAALAERFAAGDEAAFDVIYERHRPVVLAVCMGVLGAPADAEDATQETFSALAVALRTRPPAELRPWLIRVARNASIDTTRRRRHRLLTIDGEIPEVAARPASSGKAELAVVLDGIRELPEGQRMALLMRELGGHSYSEIADFLDTDEDSVKGLIARARVGLRTYREATELSCASARATIAAEPDGRRYDKTIRRHLRSCGSCRSYREALRDDAKALRAALPIQAGTVATGSLTSGMLSAAKGSLLSYGLTQAATTCAASACAVGAIGGMVFVAPVHRLGLPPFSPAVRIAPAHRHHVHKAVPVRHVVLPTHMAVPVQVSTPALSEHAPEAPAARPPAHRHAANRQAAVTHHHQHRAATTVTQVKLPPLPAVHRSTEPAAPAPSPSHATSTPVSATSAPPSTATAPPSTASTPPSTGGDDNRGSTAPSGTAPAGGSAPASGTPVSSKWAAYGGSSPAPQGTSQPTGDPGSTRAAGGAQPSGAQGTPPTGAQPTGVSGSQHSGDSGSRPGGDHHAGPVHVIIGAVASAAPSTASAASAPPAAATAPSGTPTGDTTPTSAAPVTTTPAATTPVYTHGAPGDSHGPIWQRSQSGARHAGSWHQSPSTQSATTTASPVVSTTGSSTTTASTVTAPSYGTHGWSGGSSSAQQYGRAQPGASAPQYGRAQYSGTSSSQAGRPQRWTRSGR